MARTWSASPRRPLPARLVATERRLEVDPEQLGYLPGAFWRPAGMREGLQGVLQTGAVARAGVQGAGDLFARRPIQLARVPDIETGVAVERADGQRRLVVAPDGCWSRE